MSILTDLGVDAANQLAIAALRRELSGTAVAAGEAT
jgi:hypothetical protein